MNRLVTSIPDARIEDVSIVPAVPPAESCPDGADKPSFAAVLGAPSFCKVVKKTDAGDILICNVPIAVNHAKPSRPSAPKRASRSPPCTCPPSLVGKCMAVIATLSSEQRGGKALRGSQL